MAETSTEELAAAAPNAEDRAWGMLAHLCALCGLVFPFGNVLAPFVVWRIRRARSAFIEDQAREALNFNLSVIIVALACSTLVWLLIGVALLVTLGVCWLALIIRAAVVAGEGMRYRYPLSWRFVK